MSSRSKRIKQDISSVSTSSNYNEENDKKSLLPNDIREILQKGIVEGLKDDCLKLSSK